MTRRIAITILLTVWTAIVIAGVATWLMARRALLANLDESIQDHARATLGMTGDDRFVLKNLIGQTTGRSAIPTRSQGDYPVISSRFIELPEGSRRQLVLKVPSGGPQGVPYDVSADGFNQTLQTLAAALAISGALAGAAASLLAARVARLALRPLHDTAQVIGSINEANLDRRIDFEALPVELRPMAGRLNEMLERLRGAFEQRRRFLADASHELRTPVAAMITTMEVALRRPREAAELTDTLQTCLSEARHMHQLVQALLRQVKAQGIVGEAEALDMDAGEMLRECADLAGSLAAERQVRVVRSFNGTVPVHADPGRLRSIVLNLMSNAIEYNHPGGTVEVSARSEDTQTEIIVSDDGPGIAPEHLPHLFQPFYRATSAREVDGHLGLGLFLVDSHVKAMGGECRVESTVGSGTTFRIRLPASNGASGHKGGE